MKIDPNYIVFCFHEDWYTHKKGVGYVPTDKAPEEAVKAMAAFNEESRKRVEKKKNK